MWGHWIRKTWAQLVQPRASEQEHRRQQVQYHLGRGRRAREDGQPALGVVEARRALALDPRNSWAAALLGQCLLRLGHVADARVALDRACSLDPSNGYFVRLSLEVLYAQHDAGGRANLLHRAWWAGAPVERWLTDGPPQAPRRVSLHAADLPADSAGPHPRALAADANLVPA